MKSPTIQHQLNFIVYLWYNVQDIKDAASCIYGSMMSGLVMINLKMDFIAKTMDSCRGRSAISEAMGKA